MIFNIKQELQKILNKENVNHKHSVLNLPSIKSVHIYCKIHHLSGQEFGSLIETYILHKYCMTRNVISSLTGDLCSSNNVNLEIKASNGGKGNNKFNYVQIRFNHECNYILTAFYLDKMNIESEGELFIFSLNKDNMKKIVLQHGSYAHGTKKILGDITQYDLDNIYNNKEYSIRPKYNSSCWKDLLVFRVKDIVV